MDLPPFPGFRPEAFAFLRDLAQHNDRDWFKPRKTTYDDELLWPMRCLVADATGEARRRGLTLGGDPKKSVFRIYRDTRFSKDKRPYKTHIGAVLTRTGDKGDDGLVYVHVEPGDCFVAAGFYHPPMPFLRAWRTRMAAAPGLFLDVQERLAARGLDLHTDEALKRMPRGFHEHAEGPVAEPLRWKSFLVTRAFDDEALQTPAFTGEVVRLAEDALPLLAYGWEVGGASEG